MKLVDEDFKLGKMVDDLLDYSIDMCGKDYNPQKMKAKTENTESQEIKKKTLRFPARFYDNYVNCIMDAVLKIHTSVIIANGYDLGNERLAMQRLACFNCIELNHLIRIASNKGYISEKQREHWQKLTTDIYFKIVNWTKSDNKRK